jgi:hypothetical protein
MIDDIPARRRLRQGHRSGPEARPAAPATFGLRIPAFEPVLIVKRGPKALCKATIRPAAGLVAGWAQPCQELARDLVQFRVLGLRLAS